MVKEDSPEFVCRRWSNNFSKLWRMPLACVTLETGLVDVQHLFQNVVSSQWTVIHVYRSGWLQALNVSRSNLMTSGSWNVKLGLAQGYSSHSPSREKQLLKHWGREARLIHSTPGPSPPSPLLPSLLAPPQSTYTLRFLFFLNSSSSTVQTAPWVLPTSIRTKHLCRDRL